MIVPLVLAVVSLAAEASAPSRVIVVDFESVSRAQHPCLIVGALAELERQPGARVVGIGLPSRTLVDWEEIAPEIRVGPLRSSNGLYSMEELCQGAQSGFGFKASPERVMAALKKAYAGRGEVEVTWLDDSRRSFKLQPLDDTPDSADLLKATIALAKPSTDLSLKEGCWERATRGWVYVLIEGRGQRSLKQRFSYDPSAASERLCFPIRESSPARVVIFDEKANWLGIATVQ